MLNFLVSASEPDIPRGMSILVEGTAQTEGIPGFGQNRIPALHGVYRTSIGRFVRAWVTNEPLAFNAGYWNEATAGGYRALVNASGATILYAFERNLEVKVEPRERGQWHYILEFEGTSWAGERGAFIESFIRRTDAFVSSVRRYQDISLPAVLPTAGD